MALHPKPKSEKKNNITLYSIQRQPCNWVFPIFTVNYLFLSNSKLNSLLDRWFISLLLFWISLFKLNRLILLSHFFFSFSWFFLILKSTNWCKKKIKHDKLLWIISMHPLYYEKLITIIPLSLQMKFVYFISSIAYSLEFRIC